jgi:hypothetical protein
MSFSGCRSCRRDPDSSPLKFLKGEVQDLVAMAPTLIRAEKFLLQTDLGGTVVVELSAVKVRIGEERAAVIFVDNRGVSGEKKDDRAGALEDWPFYCHPCRPEGETGEYRWKSRVASVGRLVYGSRFGEGIVPAVLL